MEWTYFLQSSIVPENFWIPVYSGYTNNAKISIKDLNLINITEVIWYKLMGWSFKLAWLIIVYIVCKVYLISRNSRALVVVRVLGKNLLMMCGLRVGQMNWITMLSSQGHYPSCH